MQPLVAELLSWYNRSARHLPWRETSDPYRVWVSEIMLQQTRVETVIPYYQRWLQRFPSLPVLAASTQQEVLHVWEGLGYYSRARNLHAAARIVIERHAGELPRDIRLLEQLPGIGHYTAAAIASIAFHLDAPALDGNIRRVLARLFDVTESVRSPAGERRLLELSWGLLPPGRAGDYNQALMDLGATLCTPRSPACGHCPISAYCQAYQLNLQDERPVKEARPIVPHYTVTAAVITRHGQFLITQRPANGLLGSLWEFPGGKLQPGEDLPACLKREVREELGVSVEVGEAFGIYQHAYTHFRVTLYAYCCALQNGDEPQLLHAQDLRWVNPPELTNYPMGKIDRQIAARLLAGVV